MDGMGEAGRGRGRGAEWSIGVDFGTAFSKAAATRITREHGAALREMTPLRLGDAAGGSRPFLVPSSMFLDRARVHFGAHAVARLTAADQDDRELARSFKTVLGANDFEGALDFYPRACIDPDRVFRLRDIVVLYLAYLLALIDYAASRQLNREGDVVAASRVCFSRPGWIPTRIAAAHEAMSGLFSQAHLVRARLGDALMAANGVAYADARAALDAAREEPALFQNLDGGIYEASAVGLCHFSDSTTPNCLLVVDVGGGTTDIAGLIRAPHSPNIRVVRTARRTIDVAGDDFDAALLDLLVDKVGRFKARGEKTAAWRRIAPSIRDIKEELFETGQVKVTVGAAQVSCSAREFENQPAFRAALGEIAQLYERSLAEVVQASRKERIRRIGVVLAGGGSRLPALRKAILKPRWIGLGSRLDHLPTTPHWGHGLASEAEFNTLFSQLSAAFGAAISSSEHARAAAA